MGDCLFFVFSLLYVLILYLQNCVGVGVGGCVYVSRVCVCVCGCVCVHVGVWEGVCVCFKV